MNANSKSTGTDNRLARLLNLLEILSTGPHRDSAEISHILGVSRRTVFRDLRVLRDAGLRFSYDHHTGKYWIERQSFRTMALSPPEILNLAMALTNVQSCNSLAASGTYLSSLVSSHLGSSSCQSLQDALDWISDQRNQGSNSTFPESLRVLFEGFQTRRKVRIIYEESGGNVVRTLLSPYQLQLTDEGWTIVGRSSVHAGDIRFSLEGLQGADLTEDVFERP